MKMNAKTKRTTIRRLTWRELRVKFVVIALEVSADFEAVAGY